MIKEDEINIIISTSNYKYYNSIGFDNLKIGQILTINPTQLPNGSHVKITAICDICKKEIKKPYGQYKLFMNNYNLYTCKKCSIMKVKLTNLKNYGVEYSFQSEEVKNKIKKTNLEKYGYENPINNEEVKEKIKNTNLEKYGYEYVLQNEEVKQKSKINCKEKYGVNHISQLKEIKNIKRKKCECRNISKNHNIINIDYKTHTYQMKCDNGYDHIFEIDTKNHHNRKRIKTIICTICNPMNFPISGYEIQLQNFIKENYDKEILFNNRNIIKPYELDIYIPKLKLAFEFDGEYWHSKRDANYHKMKDDLCKEKNIKLIHISDKDWVKNNEKIKEKIMNLFL